MDSNPDFPFGIMDVAELLQLRIRRRQADSVYVDCPFCGDNRGKMNINHVKNVWRCNYCGEYGGMLGLYAKMYHTSNSDAYREICDALQAGETSWGYEEKERPFVYTGDSVRNPRSSGNSGIPQSVRAEAREIHQTYSLLLEMLSLIPKHQNHLQSKKRGLTEGQIQETGFKSTPPLFLCRSLTERLTKQGCTVQGVPGFYLHEKGYWTMNFSSATSGILLPCVGIDGLIRGLQILLDVPLKNKEDPPDKSGTKYLWFSSSTKNLGVTSGSPVHFAGNPFARTVYVTEGLLKADIAHYLMNRTFAAVAGANNLAELDQLFGLLAQNGTELIVEAHDMDKFNNEMTYKGKLKINKLAKKYGMDCRSLTWNPNYKGIDDWQLALRRKEQRVKEVQNLNFKQQYLLGLCDMNQIENKADEWHRAQENDKSLKEYLGLSDEEYAVFVHDGIKHLERLLDVQRSCRHFRFYQLDFGDEQKPLPFAYKGIADLHKAGYEQPPAADYRLTYEGNVTCPVCWSVTEILRHLRQSYGEYVPEGYSARALSPSDVVELCDSANSQYYYVDTDGFEPVHFVPLEAKPKCIFA